MKLRSYSKTVGLKVFNVRRVQALDAKAIIEFHRRSELEEFLLSNGCLYYFENENSYFAILDDVLYTVRKKKGGKSGKG